MVAIRRFEDIQAWQRARELVRELYHVSSNVAEGFARKGDREFARFLDVARGSAVEVVSLLYVAMDAGWIDKAQFDKLYHSADEVIAMISGLSSYLRRPANSSMPNA
ncbi:MAG TPA: four helix bundle protein [Terriglobia bacterium]|nr:four helix bundle protein [Terriglobia bacterium]